MIDDHLLKARLGFHCNNDDNLAVHLQLHGYQQRRSQAVGKHAIGCLQLPWLWRSHQANLRDSIPCT